jgi:predicted ATPase
LSNAKLLIHIKAPPSREQAEQVLAEATNYAAAVSYLARFVEFRAQMSDQTAEEVIQEIGANIISTIKLRAMGPPH